MMCAIRLAIQPMVNSNGDQTLKSTHKVTIKSENDTRNRKIKLSIPNELHGSLARLHRIPRRRLVTLHVYKDLT